MRLADGILSYVRKHVLTILEGALDLYFLNREIEWFPSNGRPVLEARIVATRRVGANFYQVCVHHALGERRWIDVRRGKRDDKTGRWAFYEE